jgi:hypothetical protein
MKKMLTTLVVVTSLAIANGQTFRGATASADVVNGFVVGITVTDGGNGYTSAPPVHIIGGGGSNALATASISNSAVTSVTVNNPGGGYTTPLVSIAPPVVSPPQMSAAPASQLEFTNLIGNQRAGYAYKLEKNVSGVWLSIGPYFGSWSSDYTMIVDGTVTTNTYLLAGYPVPEQATAVAQVTNGFVVGMTLTSYGDGYGTSPPVVEISGGGGSGAQAKAGTGYYGNGIVTSVGVLSITITNPGSGYTSAPGVIIGPPDATLQLTSPPIINPLIRVDMMNLLTNLTYQLQSSTDLNAWNNAGKSFLAGTPTNSVYLYATNASDFFRLQYVP